MPDAHDPAALVRHAAVAGDWRLVDLITILLGGRPATPLTAAQRAYRTLVQSLGLAADAGNYDPS
ncbi:MAG: hypothetical protein ACLP50_33900 [Solirubrobacteraceae bacterium]